MTASLSLGLDIGTTSVSAVVADMATGRVLASCTEKHGADLPSADPGEKCQSPGILEETARRLLDRLLAQFPGVSAIGITGQMHGIVYLDSFGTPVSPLYTWQDQRAADLCPKLREATGYPIAPGYGLATHCALEKAGGVPEDARWLCTIMDYLAYVLCGRERLMLHASNAASLGFFSLETGQFDPAALKAAGIRDALLPPVTGKNALLGQYRGIPVSVAIGDNQASFLGSVPEPETMALANFGTGSQISRMVRYVPELPGESGLEVRPFLEGSYLLCGSALCGGRAYALLERFFHSFAARCGVEEENVYSILNDMAREGLSRQDLPLVDTTFCGTRAEPSLRGAIRNLSDANFTPEAITAGMLLGMARELKSLLQAMPAGKITGLAASGNAVRNNPGLCQAIRQVFALEVTVPVCPEEAAFGAACFAAWAVREITA